MADEVTLEECLQLAEGLGTFQIPWGHVHELAAMSIYELCALSIGVSPIFVETVDAEVSRAPDDTVESRLWKESYSPPFEYFEARRRCAVAVTHLGLDGGLIPAGGDAAGPKTIVRVADFLRWAHEQMGWSMPVEFDVPGRECEETKTGDAPLEIESVAGDDRATAKAPGRRGLQLALIVQMARNLGFDPLAVPKRGKGQIKDLCLAERKDLFTSDGFDHAWKEAIKGDDPIVRMKEHKTYARRC